MELVEMEGVKERVAKLEARMNNVENDVRGLMQVTNDLSKAVTEIKTSLALWRWLLPIVLSILVAFIIKYLP
ncbi:hypothetical protein DRO54_08770 [Candidatus Bathyarchaeota archaeon]|nr:MAG: hypothetical protein DRO54_08770 [Candidatus Bathyarchaeota archaeon]